MSNKKSKVEKKIGIKAFTRKGKRVKAFRRRQKVNREENKTRNRLLVGLGATAALGVGGIAAAKLIKNAKNKKLANAARKVKPDVPAPSPSKPSASASPPAAPPPNYDQYPENVRERLETYEYKPPEVDLLAGAKRPKSYENFIKDPNNKFFTINVDSAGGWTHNLDRFSLTEAQQKAISQINNLGGDINTTAIKNNGNSLAVYMQLDDDSGFIVKIHSLYADQSLLREKRPAGMFNYLFLDKSVDPRYLDLDGFAKTISPPGNRGINEEAFSHFDAAARASGTDSFGEHLDKGMQVIERDLRSQNWQALDKPNPKIKPAIEHLSVNRKVKNLPPEEKQKELNRFWRT